MEVTFDFDYFSDSAFSVEPEDISCIEFIVEGFSSLQKLIFNLRYIEGLTIQEITDRYGISKTSICYNEKKMKEKMLIKLKEMGYTI